MRKKVTVSAPHRLDIGGTWDLSPFALFGATHNPCTVTIAIEPRIVVEVSPGGQSGIEMHSIQDNIGSRWHGQCADFDYTGPFGLMQAILSFFEVTDASITIKSELPAQLGLGGSGAVTVALITAIATARGRDMTVPATVQLAHEIENCFFSMTGYQDQLAALAGGVQLWNWQFPMEKTLPTTLLHPEDYHELEQRLVIAVVGKHNSSDVNERQVATFMAPQTRQEWVRVNSCTKCAAHSLEDKGWRWLEEAIRIEHMYRHKLVPERVVGLERFMAVTNAYPGAFATAGAGQAVCWYFSENIDHVNDVRRLWGDLDAHIFPTKITSEGMTLTKALPSRKLGVS